MKFEGALRIFWDVKQTISFQKLDESVPEKQKADIRETYQADIEAELEKVASESKKHDLDKLVSGLSISDPKDNDLRYNTIGLRTI